MTSALEALMNSLRIALFITASVCTATPIAAQTMTSAVREKVQAARTVTIVDDEGRRIDGRVIEMSDQTLRISVHRAIEQIRIDRIVRIEKPDSLKNGAYAG